MSDEQNTSSKSSKRILVVDDESEICDIFRFYIESKMEAVVDEANSGNGAIEKIRSSLPDRPYDLIVCDYRMPNGTGGDVFQFLKAEAIETPFIFCSAERPEDQKEFVGHKIDGYIQKPFIKENLLKILEERFSGSGGPQAESYIKVHVDTLLKIPVLEFDVFIKINGSKYIAVLQKNDHFDPEDAKKYHDKEVDFLYIRTSEATTFLQAFHRYIFSDYMASNIPIEKTFEVSKQSTEMVKELQSQLGWTPEVQEVANRSAQVALNQIAKNSQLKGLIDRFEADPNNYFSSHSTMVSFLSVSMAEILGWGSPSTNHRLALAAILHDYALTDGQLKNIEALDRDSNRPDLQDVADIRKYREHPILAAEGLQTWEDIHPDVTSIILNHHEKPDGSGFPTGKDYREFSQIAAVFVVAEDIADFFHLHQGKKVDLPKFVADRRVRYSNGDFAPIWKKLNGQLVSKAN